MAADPNSSKISNLAIVLLAIIAFAQLDGTTILASLNIQIHYLEVMLGAIGLLIALLIGLFIKDPPARKQTLVAGAIVFALGVLMGLITYWAPSYSLL